MERSAYAATLGSRRRYFSALKALESGPPETVWPVHLAAVPRGLLRHQGVPLMPIDRAPLYALALLLAAPFVLAAIVVNAPAVLGGYLAARKFADARNVITLWRLLVGAPLLALWAVALVVVGACRGHPAWALAYLALTWIGLRLFYRVKKLAVAVYNWVFHASCRTELLKLHATLHAALPDDPL